MITTTLKKIRDAKPCENGYRKLCRNLGGIRKYGGNTPVTFKQILDSNGLDDAIWCLRTIDAPEVRLFACDCAERVLHIFEDKYPDDDGPRKVIKDARAYALDPNESNRQAMEVARAARAVAWAEGAVAGAADTAEALSWVAAWAAEAAARVAGAAGDDAWIAERKEQEKLFIKYFCEEK